MSVKSTMEIQREDAIKRIEDIYNLIRTRNYLAIESTTSEEDPDELQKFVDNHEAISGEEDLESYTNHMLTKIMDRPFFRYSMLENYVIK